MPLTGFAQKLELDGVIRKAGKQEKKKVCFLLSCLPHSPCLDSASELLCRAPLTPAKVVSCHSCPCFTSRPSRSRTSRQAYWTKVPWRVGWSPSARDM